MKIKTIFKRLEIHGLDTEFNHQELIRLTNRQRKEFMETIGIRKPGPQNPPLKQIVILRWFHQKVKESDYEGKLRMMKWMAEQNGRFKPRTRKQYKKAREHWEKKKHTFSNRRTTCLLCQGKAQVRHHLFQLQNGGYNLPLNIIGLCRPCHAEIHPWLSHSN